MKPLNSASLPFIAASAQAVQYAHAGYLMLDWPGATIGLVIGATVSLSAALAASRLAGIQGKRRYTSGLVALLAVLILSPAAVMPAFYEHLAISSLPLRLIASLSWAIAPDAAIILAGTITGGRMIKDADQHQAATQPAALATNLQRTKRAQSQRCEWCGAVYRSKGAHMRQRHPDRVQHKVYAISKELINGK